MIAVTAQSRFADLALLCLYQHRLLTTTQLHRLLTPGAATSAYCRRELHRLQARGLIASITDVPVRQILWFLTSEGASLVEDASELPHRPYRMTPERAAGPARHHTIAVNDAGIAFVEAARRHGDDCGPLSWTPEVAHRLTSPADRAQARLIPDAVLHYVVEDAQQRQRSQLQFFIELDRATMPVSRLAAKLLHYARYYDHRGPRTHAAHHAWQALYPRFPRILIILTGHPQRLLHRRMRDLAAYSQAMPYLHRPRSGFEAAATTLADLRACGPHTAAFLPLAGQPDWFQASGQARPNPR